MVISSDRRDLREASGGLGRRKVYCPGSGSLTTRGIAVAPVCSNCNGTEFVWANELKTGMTGGGSLSLRARGEIPIGTRICRTCGHADLFLRDISILHQPHNWRPGEFIPIVAKPSTKPAPHAHPPPPAAPAAPATATTPTPAPPNPPMATPTAPVVPASPPPGPAPTPVAAREAPIEETPSAPPPRESETPAPSAEEPVAEKPKIARRRSPRSKS